jgi:hypothetical protein
MRTVFLLLVLANVAFFAWSRFLAPPDPGLDSRPLERQIEPDKLRIVAPAELARAVGAKPKPPPAPDPVKAAEPPIIACLEWGSFAPAEAPRAEKVLDPLGLGPRLGRHQVEEAANWWVHMPPQGSRLAAQRKAAELKSLGISEYFIIQDEGPYRWSLSLGVFRAEAAADEHLAALRRKGVRTARVTQRELQVPKVWLRIAKVDAALDARLKEIALAFPGSELRECR